MGGYFYIEGPGGVTFSTYDVAYRSYYEIEYLESSDGKIFIVGFEYDEQTDDSILVWTDYETGV